MNLILEKRYYYRDNGLVLINEFGNDDQIPYEVGSDFALEILLKGKTSNEIMANDLNTIKKMNIQILQPRLSNSIREYIVDVLEQVQDRSHRFSSLCSQNSLEFSV